MILDDIVKTKMKELARRKRNLSLTRLKEQVAALDKKPLNLAAALKGDDLRLIAEVKKASPSRKEIGIRTVFNILGPMTNPAGAQAQLLGVFDEELTLKMAEVLSLLGCRHALVVHGEDGLDEVTLGGKTTVCELKGGEISRYQVDPDDFGFPRTELTRLRGGPPQENADILRRVLKREKGPYRDIVVINAAAALVAGDMADDLGKGTRLAADAIDSGRALDKLEKLISLSRRL